MSRRALKGINWAAIAERIPESQKGNYAAFKSKSDMFMRKVSEYPAEPMKIDWAMYKKTVPVSGMVDRFQKEYEALKVPYPVDNYTQKIENEEKEVLSYIEKFIQESNARIAEAQADNERIKALLPFDQMTLEDFAEAYPEEAINIDKPTIWPHTEEYQPDDREVATPMPKEEH